MEIEFNKKQQQFLASDADITLFGGGAGSGKSLAAVFAALVLNDARGPRYRNPAHRALIYRKHYKDLRDIVDKSRKYYPIIDPSATYNQSEMTWSFGSGAKIMFHYFERIEDAEIYLQGQEYDLILCDEIGQYEDDRVFKYALSRLRNSDGMKNYFLATSNPSRYKWLRDFWQINDQGDSTAFSLDFAIGEGKTVTKEIKYIQAKLSDNPYIPEEYAANIMMMSDEDKRALLDGRWDAYESVDGQVYKDELFAMQQEHRLCAVPFDPALDVYTSWDLGIDDCTCILFWQFSGKERHVINMILDNNKGLRDYYIPLVKQWGKSFGYNYKAHYLPHDSEQRSKFTADSLLAQVSAILPDCKKIPIISIETGIQKTKQLMKYTWIDSSCGLDEQLINYKRKWSPELQVWGKPLHDKFSHAADCFRYGSYIEIDNGEDKEMQSKFRVNNVNPFVGNFR